MIAPTWESKCKTVKLWHGDCLEVMKGLPDKSIDLVLTDPPFGMSFQSGHRIEKHNKIENDDNLDWLPEWAEQTARILKDDGFFDNNWK